jgi:hypothetical protein
LAPLFLVAAALVLLLCGVAWADEPSLSISLEPGSSEAQATGYFVISASQGQAVEESAVLRNLSQKDVTVSLAAVDGATGLYGGITYALPTDPVKNVGAWITLSQTEVDLKARESVEIPFTVNVPSDAPSGTNVGGITAWVPALSESTDSTAQGFGAQIIIQTRRVLAVQVTLPGPSDPVLTISGVTPIPRASGMELDIALANTGHGLAGGSGTIDIPALDFHKDFTLGSVLPGTSFAYPIIWSEKPEANAYDAKVTINYNGKTLDWAGSFTVGATALTQLQNYETSMTANQPASSKSSLNTIILIVAVAVAWVIILVAGGLLLWRRLRRRKTTQPRPGDRGTPPEAGNQR